MLSERKRRELIENWEARAQRQEDLAERLRLKEDEDGAHDLLIISDCFRLAAEELQKA